MSSTPSQDTLSHALEHQFGLRNLRPDWLRRQTVFSPEVLTGPIARADLPSITRGTLPWRVSAATSVTLGVNVLTQIEDVINVATPNPRAPGPPRVLQFTLSDGATDFVALELEPLGPRFSLALVPGTKLLLHACAPVRRGRVLLRPADCTLLAAAPPANVWGQRYPVLVSQRLADAGLPDPNASTFDSIQRRNPVADLGGIADAVPTHDTQNGDDEDDDVFWMQAAVAADAAVAEASAFQLPHPPPPAPQESALRAPNPRAQAVQSHISPGGDVEMAEAPSAATHGVTQPQQHTGHHQPPPQLETGISPPSDIEIPEMPICESDADAPPPDATTGNNGISSIVHTDSHQDSQWPELSAPVLPIGRLSDLAGSATGNNDTTARSDGNAVWARVYSPRAERRRVVDWVQNRLELSAPLDDGTYIAWLRMRPDVVEELTGIGDIANAFRTGGDIVGLRIRKAVRALCGFVRLECEPGGVPVITKVAPVPSVQLSSFLTAYADNVEARFASYMMGGGPT